MKRRAMELNRGLTAQTTGVRVDPAGPTPDNAVIFHCEAFCLLSESSLIERVTCACAKGNL